MKLLSGIQPTGKLHLGNYLGSILLWVDMLSKPDVEAVFMIADLHAITVPYDVKALHERVLELVAIYLSAGIDYKKHTIFLQSHNPDHTYASWLLGSITPVGWLKRMTQFKDKSKKVKNANRYIGSGILNYPLLMAADILLYNVDYVPVGEDQTQHVELTRDIAKKFNKTFGETFKVPKVKINKVVARIKDLQNPTKKMSKSDVSGKGRIDLTDPPDVIKTKILRAVTDSDTVIKYDPSTKPGISNLLSIYSVITGKSIKELELMYEGKRYSEFKKDLADNLIMFLRPLQQKVNEYLSDKAELSRILKFGADKAKEQSHKMLNKMLKNMGYVL